MVGNMIRVLRARMTLLAVDEAGMSTVEYSIVVNFNESPIPEPALGRWRSQWCSRPSDTSATLVTVVQL